MYKRQLACLSHKLFKNELPVSLTKWQAEKKTGWVLRNNHRVKLPTAKLPTRGLVPTGQLSYGISWMTQLIKFP